MEVTELYADDPDPEHKIEELHVWIATYTNKGEGIIGADLEWGVLGQRRHVPLMSSRREVAEAFRGKAREVQRKTMHLADKIVKIDLRTFRRVE